MTKSFATGVFLIVMATLSLSDAFAQGPSPGRGKLDAALSSGKFSGKPRIIVQYREGRGEKVLRRAEARGAKVRRKHALIEAMSMEVNRDEIARLASDPDVLSVSLDAPVQGSHRGGSKGGGNKKSTLTKIENAHLLAQIVGVPAGLTGRNVGVAVIDSGIAASPDLTIAGAFDFTGTGEPRQVQPSDNYGHGTHVAGLIAGNGSLSGGKYAGIAPGVRLYSLKVLDGDGGGYTSDVIEALDLVAQYPEHIQIVNLSLGHPIYESPATDPLVRAVERVSQKGVLVIVSAGNHGYDKATGEIGYAGITSPGNAPSALTVGSMKTANTVSRLDDGISKFSSRGPTWLEGRVKPDIVAPGENLVAISTTATKLYSKKHLRADIAPYIRLSGTSMAAGVATGVAALMMEANQLDEGSGKPLTPNTIKAILQYSAIPVPDMDPSIPDALEQGTGGINAGAAIAFARAIEPLAPIGSWWLETAVATSSVFDGVTFPWAQHIVWGDSLVAGDAAFYNLPTWSQHIVWGDSVTWTESQHIVWGDMFNGVDLVTESFLAWSNHIVWGDSLIWTESQHIVWGDLSSQHVVWGDSTDEHIVWGDTEVYLAGQ